MAAFKSRTGAILAGFLAFASTAFSISAQTIRTWTGAGTNSNWSTAANWGGTAPVSGNGLTFSGSTHQANNNDISGLNNLAAITFNSTGWNIAGNAVTVTNNFFETATGSNTWGVSTTLGNTLAINQSATGDILNFTGVLSGSGGFSTVAGAGGVGTVYLSNPNNSFTGSVSISSATAVFYSLANGGQNSCLGAGTGTITFGSTATSYEGTLIYAGTSSGATGRAFQAQARTTGSPTFCNNSPNNSSLTFNGGWSGKGLLNPFTIELQGTSGGTNTFNAAISDSVSPYPVSLEISGPGRWVFAANNTYQGTTTLDGGVLQLGDGGTTGNMGSAATNSLLFSGDATLAINRSDVPIFLNAISLAGNDTFSVVAGRSAALGGVISGAGAFVNNSPGGVLALTNANTFTGNTTISAGTLTLGAKGSISGSPVISIAGGATFDVSSVSGGFNLGAAQTLNGLGATAVLHGSVNLGAGALSLVYSGGSPVLSITGGSLNFNNNPVTIVVPFDTVLSTGTYELIAPGSGGAVAGSVASSMVSANLGDDPSLSLQISNGGLYLIVNPSTASIPTTTTLASSPNPVAFGTVPVTFTATVSPAPTNGEVVTFLEGNNVLGVSILTNGCASLSLTNMALGSHAMSAVYRGDGLFEPSTSSIVIQIVSPTVAIYPQGPAFPLFMYEIDATYPALSAYGWNIMQEYGLNTNSDVNTFLQGLLVNNVSGPAIIPPAGTNHPYSGWSQAAVQAWVQSIAVNTNLAWWSLPEELSPNYTGETNVLHNYTAWTRLYDPAQRPTYEYTENADKDTVMKGIIPNVDVVGVSCYCEEVAMPHAWVRYKLQQVGRNGAALAGVSIGSNYLAGQKTLVAVLSVSQFSGNSPSEPTSAQTYHDFWSSIVSGAQGVAVWAYFHAQNDDPANLTNNLNQVNLAASQITGAENLGAMLLNGTPNPGVTFKVTVGPTNTVAFTPPGQTTNFQYSSLNLLSKTWNGVVYVIAVNSTSSNVTATMSNVPSASASASLPFESRSVAMNNGVFSDTFGAWGVHIYKMRSTNNWVVPILYSAVPSGAGSYTLNFSGGDGQHFRVLSSTDLTLPLLQWTTVTNGVFGPGLITVTDHVATSSKFYRIASP